eukprot:scaffold1.g5575.t1
MRCTCAFLTALLALAAAPAAAWSLSAAPAPRFAVVPAGSYKSGKDQLESIAAEADKEGFLDRVLGTNCFSAAVKELNADCRRMQQEQKSRLALRLVNCHQGAHGGDTFPCGRRQPLKACIEGLPDRLWHMYVEFFEKYTENMLNRLSEGAQFARDRLADIGGAAAALATDAAALRERAGEALGLLREQRELGAAVLEEATKARAESAAYFSSLDAKQSESLALADRGLAAQEALAAGQAAAAAALATGREQVAQLLGAVEARGVALAAAQAEQAAAQAAAAAALRGLTDDSRGLRSAVDVVLSYQQRSDAVLLRLLGKSYSLEDVAFYGAGALAAAAAGASRATAGARGPIVALLGVSLLGERLLLDRLHLWLEVDDSGAVVLPLARWLPFLPAAAGAVDLRWALRKAAGAAAALLVAYHLAAHRNYERDSYRQGLLVRLDEEGRRRHEEYLLAVKQQRLDFLQALAAGGGGGARPGRGGARRKGEGAAAAEAAAWGLAAELGPAPQSLRLEGCGAGALDVVPYASRRTAGGSGRAPESNDTASDNEGSLRPQLSMSEQKRPVPSLAPAAASPPHAQPTPAARAGRPSKPHAAPRQQAVGEAGARQRKRAASTEDLEPQADAGGGKRQAVRQASREPGGEAAAEGAVQAARSKRGRKASAAEEAESGKAKRRRRG